MKPLILITPSLSDDEELVKINRAYAKCIKLAGGASFLPGCYETDDMDALINMASGILFSGGVDIDPSYFGEPPMRNLGEVTPARDAYELALVKLAAKRDMPILGICRGVQIINVAFGGKIYQDIYCREEYTIKHRQQMPKHYPSHLVKLNSGSFLSAIMGVSELSVNSLHHQAISTCGSGLTVAAKAPDGIIEAIEHKGLRFCLGVQWHPEQMNDEMQQKIFREFIKHAKNTKAGGNLK